MLGRRGVRLLSFLAMEGEGEDDETLQLLAGLAGQAAAEHADGRAGGQADAGVADPGGLRCVDSTHPPDCKACTQAPTTEEGLLFELVGDAGKKNGVRTAVFLLPTLAGAENACPWRQRI